MKSTMAVPVLIVPAREQDVPLIFRFIRELAEYEGLMDHCATTEERIKETFFGPEPAAQAVFAYQDQEPVGFAVFYYTYSTFTGRPGLYLEDLYVRPEARGKGIGRGLLGYLARLGQDRGCIRMEWAVLDWNVEAIRFYERLGARPIDGWSVYRLAGEPLEKLTGEESKSG
jgi:GNAT superfamily N-acetyltransferase